MSIKAIRQNILDKKKVSIAEDIIIFGYGFFLIVKNYSAYAFIYLQYKFPFGSIDVNGGFSWFFGEGKGFAEKFGLVIVFVTGIHKIFKIFYPVIKRSINRWIKK